MNWFRLRYHLGLPNSLTPRDCDMQLEFSGLFIHDMTTGMGVITQG